MADTRLWDGAAADNAFDTATNWSDDTAPIAGDTAIMPDGNIVVVDGSDENAYTLAAFTVSPGYSGTIGSRTAGVITNLQIAATTVNLAGSGVTYLNLTACTTCNVTGAAAGTPDSGTYGLTLSGATIATLNIDLTSNQSVGVAALAGQTGTVTNAYIGGNGTVVLGAGLTLSTAVSITGSGTTYIDCAVPALTVTGSATVYIRSGAQTTLVIQGGVVYLNSTGTITTASVFTGGSLICTQGPETRTITNTNLYGDATLDDSAKKTTFSTAIKDYGSGTNLRLGSNKTITRGTI